MGNIVLIPARGGSKSIKKKNIIELGNKPLIYYTINIAKKLQSIDKIIVSTDDNEIKEISLLSGAEVPFIRPKEFSDDAANDFMVVNHFLNWLIEKNEVLPENIIYLRPDFPFRKSKVLNEAIELYNLNKEADGLRSVQLSKEIPYKMWMISKDYLSSVVEYNDMKDPHNSSRQLFPKIYWPVGYIEIYDTKVVLRDKTLRGKKMLPFIIHEEIINIGSINELKLAKSKINDFKFD